MITLREGAAMYFPKSVEEEIRQDERRKVWLEAAEMAETTALDIKVHHPTRTDLSATLERMACDGLRIFAQRLYAKAKTL